MSPDILSVVLRSASFMALFQAVGVVFFVALFGRHLQASIAPIRRIARRSALIAMAFLACHYAIEAARMADDMAGIVDSSLQTMVLSSARSVVLAVRLMGLTLISIGIGQRGDGSNSRLMRAATVGAILAAASFVLEGHTSAHPLRWVLAPLLMAHLTIVAFWFGALLPLYLASIHETPRVAGQITEAFSRVAGWLVPGILVAGFLLALILVRHMTVFSQGYGKLLIGKFVGFALLMGFGALNKWRLGPAIASGNPAGLRAFRRSLGIEYLLISVVFSLTAIMTTFYSPEP